MNEQKKKRSEHRKENGEGDVGSEEVDIRDNIVCRMTKKRVIDVYSSNNETQINEMI